MLKIKKLFLSAIIVFTLCLAGASILFLNHNSSREASTLEHGAAETKIGEVSTKPEESTATDEGMDKGIFVKEIPVEFNSPEYDLRLNLNRNSQRELFIKLDYYLDGESVEKVIGNNTFEILQEDSIKKASLNPKKGNLYFFLEKHGSGRETPFELYVFNLKKAELRLILASTAQSRSELKFSPDKKYITFDFLSTASDNNSLLCIIDCDNNIPVVQNNKTAGELMTGKKTTTGGKEKKGQKTQPYKESASLKTLKDFYGYLSKEEYNKAYDLLDDRFKLNAFKVFGAAEMTRKDIDVRMFTDFAASTGIFKSLKIDRVLEEKAENGNSKIYFYQSIAMSEGAEPVLMPLVVSLRNPGGSWKIASFDDGDINKIPFKQ